MSDIRLYCLPRTDMASMCAGRMAAQVSHASTKMVMDIQQGNDKKAKEALDIWLKEGGGFGTAIIIQPLSKMNQETEIRNLVHLANKCDNIYAGLLIDPEYYIVDGDFAHRLENILTCSYFFGDTDAIKMLLGNHPLY